jgi:DNA helicase-2/ATP-dependent DNA helicase PcrA
MKSPYLANLNPEQRRAVEYGGPSYADAGPLLIIAGAGSGKTQTLAHRVANLIINGVDPRRRNGFNPVQIPCAFGESR